MMTGAGFVGYKGPSGSTTAGKPAKRRKLGGKDGQLSKRRTQLGGKDGQLSKRRTRKLAKKGQGPSRPLSPITRVAGSRIVKSRAPGMVQAHGEPTRAAGGLAKQGAAGLARGGHMKAALKTLGRGTQGANQRKAKVAKRKLAPGIGQTRKQARRGRPKAGHFSRFM